MSRDPWDTPELAALRAAEPRQWRIDLPISVPISMNDREHWRTGFRTERNRGWR